MYDVVIIGAGIVGGMIARELSRYNVKICIVEKENDVAEGATKANSAIIHAGFDAKCGSLKARLNVLGSEMMESIANELNVKYKKNGALVIGFNDEDKECIQGLLARGEKNGVKDLKILEGKEIQKIEPNISKDVVCALYAPTSAIVCPYELTIAAIGNAMDNGAELIRNFEVSSIDYSDKVYTLKSKNEQIINSRYIINAAGVYSDKIAAMIGDNSFKIHPRRGEYILMDRDDGDIVSHTIFRTPSKMGKGILVSPTVDNNLLAGPTSVDIDDKDNKDTTASGFNQIMREARENIPTIAFNKSITSFCGLRAVGDTGDFIIEKANDTFVNVAGIESPGLSSSPAIALYVKDILSEMGLELTEKDNFNPYRKSPHFFSELSVEDKNKVIAQDRRYGKIICRCETITEGEIVYAINQNPKPLDMDGVKRRTRAQMGRCQGGFCSPYIVEILSRELGIPYENVTKFGGNSVINIGKTKENGKSE